MAAGIHGRQSPNDDLRSLQTEEIKLSQDFLEGFPIEGVQVIKAVQVKRQGDFLKEGRLKAGKKK